MIWISRLVIGGAALILAGVTVSMTATVINESEADMYLSPSSGVYTVGEPIVVSLRIRSDVPANVFAGELKFNPDFIEVEKIDYNISIADLWAIEPWYENGDGTLQFAGGTTMREGFTGDDQLLVVTFKSKRRGEASLELLNATILEHDGLGTEAEIVEHPIDALFSLDQSTLSNDTVFWKDWSGGTIAVEPEVRLTDLNSDGKQNIADISIFMLDLVNNKSRSDFNRDGVVDAKDLSIILNAK